MKTSPEKRRKARADKYRKWQAKQTEHPVLAIWKTQSRRSCRCGVKTYDSFTRPKDIVVSPEGDEYCAPCYAITDFGQTEISDYVAQLAETD